MQADYTEVISTNGDNMLGLKSVDIPRNEEVEVAKGEIYSSMGQLYEVLGQGGPDLKKTLSFSGNLFLLEKGKTYQRSRVGDFDIFTDSNGIRVMERLLRENGRKLGIEDLKVVHGEVPPYFGSAETRHLGCTIQLLGGKRRELDIYANYEPDGTLMTSRGEISMGKDVTEVPIDYLVGTESRHRAVQVFKAGAILELYRHLADMQKFFLALTRKDKPRGASISTADWLNFVDMDWGINTERATQLKEDMVRHFT